MTRVPVLFTAFLVFAGPAVAQPAPGGPPAVGVVRAERQQITQTDEFIGRIQAVGRVALVAPGHRVPGKATLCRRLRGKER